MTGYEGNERTPMTQAPLHHWTHLENTVQTHPSIHVGYSRRDILRLEGKCPHRVGTMWPKPLEESTKKIEIGSYKHFFFFSFLTIRGGKGENNVRNPSGHRPFSILTLFLTLPRPRSHHNVRPDRFRFLFLYHTR